MQPLSCKQCGSSLTRKAAVFCSYACAGKWRSAHQRGEAHGRYLAGVIRTKDCAGCGVNMDWQPGQRANYAMWAEQKFCSRPCADKHAVRLCGEQHPNFNADSRRKSGRGKQSTWSQRVISRDGGACTECGAKEGLHAHHIKPFADHPELRWDENNGQTLCFRCHSKIHAASNENAVNSVEPLTGHAEGNTEPSFGRKPVEGVTTRGRAYRRWEGSCEWCSAFISKAWSDVKGNSSVCCSKQCAGKLKASRRTYRPAKNMQRPMAVISSTSPARESEDIV